MEDEFALCWNNFQDNIASGFQNLFERGDLVDVTLACDGKLLHAHKIVLAICSPYFQEMFRTNPCKHPIIVLKDVTHGVMMELLQFMYQGVVNVKHAELSSFMKIAQTLQIKGLATSTTKPFPQHPLLSVDMPTGKMLNTPEVPLAHSGDTDSSILSTFYNKKLEHENLFRRQAMELLGGLERIPRKVAKRSHADITETDISGDSADNLSTDGNYMPQIPHVTMSESRFDLNNLKRETPNDNSDGPIGHNNVGSNFATTSGTNIRHSDEQNSPLLSGFPFNASNKPTDYSTGLHGISDFSRSYHNDSGTPVAPGDRWYNGKLEFMLSQRGKPLLVHDGHTFGIQYIRKDKKYWQCNLSRKFNCKARVTTTDTGEIIVTNNEHCHTEIRNHLRKGFKSRLSRSSEAKYEQND